jgi:hypothetical protein
MIDLTMLVIISTMGIMQADGSYDTEWELQLYEEHELYEYQLMCSPQTAGCTWPEPKKIIALYLPFKDMNPMWGGTTVLNHEILHAKGLNHQQIAEQYPNPVFDLFMVKYVPYDKSPKLLASIEHMRTSATP